MSHSNSIIKGYKAEGATTAWRIVKYGTADNQVVQSTAVGDAHIGIAVSIDSDIGEQCDVCKLGPAEVRLGGAVTRGALLTSDVNGKAVTAVPAAGTNNRIVAIADASGVLDDIIPCTVVLGSFQG